MCIEILTEVRSGVGILRQRTYVRFEVLANSLTDGLAYYLPLFQVKGGKHEDPKKPARRDRLDTALAAWDSYSNFAHFVPGPGLYVRTGRISYRVMDRRPCQKQRVELGKS